jgi:hypothetical protein
MTSINWTGLSNNFQKAKKTGYWSFFCFSVESSYVNYVVANLGSLNCDSVAPSPNQEFDTTQADDIINLMCSLKSFKLARKPSWLNPFTWFSASPFVNNALEKVVFATISNAYSKQTGEYGQSDESVKKVVAVAQFLQDENVNWSAYREENFVEGCFSDPTFLFKQRACALLKKSLEQYRPKTSVLSYLFGCCVPCFSGSEKHDRFDAISGAINTFSAEPLSSDNLAEALKALLVSIKRASIGDEIKHKADDNNGDFDCDVTQQVFKDTVNINGVFLNPILTLAQECGIELPPAFKQGVLGVEVKAFKLIDDSKLSQSREDVESDLNERFDALMI